MKVIIAVCLLGFNVLLVHGLAPRTTLSDGNQMPRVALGTGVTPDVGEVVINSFENITFEAIEVGFRHIDTAALYTTEAPIGRALARAFEEGLVQREDMFITTKLWNTNHSTDQVVPALRESLSKLGLEYVDLYLMHFPISLKDDNTNDVIDYLDTWKGMEQAQELGLAKSIGISNFNSSQIERLVNNSNVVPAVIEFEVNPTMTQEPLVDFCTAMGIEVMAYSPFGFLVERDGVTSPPPPRPDDPELVKIANKYNKSVYQIVVRYLIDRGVNPITKTKNRDHMAENIGVFDFSLTEDEVQTISNFNKDMRVIDSAPFKDNIYYPFVSKDQGFDTPFF